MITGTQLAHLRQFKCLRDQPPGVVGHVIPITVRLRRNRMQPCIHSGILDNVDLY